MKKLIATVLMITLLLTSAAVCEEAVDYSDPETWVYYADGEEKIADVFFLCPSVGRGNDGETNITLDDEVLMPKFIGATTMQKGIYDDYAAFYAPFYRQYTMKVFNEKDENLDEYCDIAYSDVKAAFEYYLENSDPERPLILAGFSQGSQMALMLLEDYFDDEALMSRLVAAYLPGWILTDEDLKEYPFLKPAEGEDDTGVIIMYNSEAEEINDSAIVPEGTFTYCINPLNWKTDSTPADKSENMGACFVDYSGEITTEITGLTGAYIDEDRHTLKLPDIVKEDYSNTLFPDGVYHPYDYQFFYRNLEENVFVRLEAWQEAR